MSLIPLQIYDLAYEKAKGMLLTNRRVLEKITEELLEFEILTQKVKSSRRWDHCATEYLSK